MIEYLKGCLRVALPAAKVFGAVTDMGCNPFKIQM
jgi:hypothetical protein